MLKFSYTICRPSSSEKSIIPGIWKGFLDRGASKNEYLLTGKPRPGRGSFTLRVLTTDRTAVEWTSR